MFWHRLNLPTGTDSESVSVGFTDASINLRGAHEDFEGSLAAVERECNVRFARLNQVHGSRVVVVKRPSPAEHSDVLEDADALVTATRQLGLMVRAADCVPVLLADASAGVIGAAHAGRQGVQVGVIGAVLEQMRALGALTISAWIGPHVCGACYEVPEEMRREVSAVVPQVFAQTSWGTPSLDLGAGVAAQLKAAEVAPTAITQVTGCTREEPRLHSHRRDGDRAGRMAGLIWLT